MRPGVTMLPPTSRASVPRQSVADRGHFSVGEGDVGDAVESLGRIDHAAILENEIVIHG